MNCCKNESGDHQKNSMKGHMAHIVMMILCCAIPMVLILALPLIGKLFPGSVNALSAAVPFLCPILMIAMIPMMMKGRKEKQVK